MFNVCMHDISRLLFRVRVFPLDILQTQTYIRDLERTSCVCFYFRKLFLIGLRHDAGRT